MMKAILLLAKGITSLLKKYFPSEIIIIRFLKTNRKKIDLDKMEIGTTNQICPSIYEFYEVWAFWKNWTNGETAHRKPFRNFNPFPNNKF